MSELLGSVPFLVPSVRSCFVSKLDRLRLLVLPYGILDSCKVSWHGSCAVDMWVLGVALKILVGWFLPFDVEFIGCSILLSFQVVVSPVSFLDICLIGPLSVRFRKVKKFMDLKVYWSTFSFEEEAFESYLPRPAELYSSSL